MNLSYSFFDTHTHLAMKEFAQDLNETLERAKAAGIQEMIAIGASQGWESNHAAYQLAQKYQFMYATVGIHPHESNQWNKSLGQKLIDLARSDCQKVRAWGEIGLDYHYLHSSKEEQTKAFQEQIEIAFDLQLPIIIHTREAEADTLAFLQNHQAKIHRVVIHCFTGAAAFANPLLDLDAYIGVGGVITFRSAQAIRQAVAAYPLERILLETDCPYMAPVPHRGQRNEPAFVPDIAQKLAEIKNTTVEEIAIQTSRNAKRFFGLPE